VVPPAGGLERHVHAAGRDPTLRRTASAGAETAASSIPFTIGATV